MKPSQAPPVVKIENPLALQAMGNLITAGLLWKASRGRTVTTYTFEVSGPPSGKQRPRSRIVLQKGKKPWAQFYQPHAGAFRARVADSAVRAGVKSIDGPVRVQIVVLRKMPLSWSKKKRASLLDKPCMVKPDAGNVECEVHDGLTGVAYKDDCQVAESSFLRHWAEVDMTAIEVRPILEVRVI